MTPEVFQAVRRIFDEVIDLPMTAHAARIQELTSDQSVVEQVLALLVANEAATDLTGSTPVRAMLAGASNIKLASGEVLGAWRVDREIGHGGMGSVYLVERHNGHFQQTAALKFIRGLPSAERLQHFARERQLLAKLTHPNIARLLDGGATEAGQPYLVMEYIDGVPIDVYCQQNRLTRVQILNLFVHACDAVAFAHRQLIVHCDLKPSNLLINQEGRPILLDFGIARLVDRVGTAGEPGGEPTAAYTPRYASPEQRESGVISTVSDIYSLGVMLGELLDANAKQDGELNAILTKATEHSPEKRYATVDAFTDDIARIALKLPVRAMPHTPPYVAKKFLQRRWPLVLVGIAFAATVIGFTVKVLVESQRAVRAEQSALRARDRAQSAETRAVKERDATKLAEADALRERDVASTQRDRATEAEQIAAAQRNLALKSARAALSERDRASSAEAATKQTNDFLISVFDATDPNAASGDLPASTLLTVAEGRIETEMQRQPHTQAELFAVIGKVRRNMGSTNLAQKNYKRAIEIERRHDRPLILAKMLADSARLDLDSFGGREALPLARESLVLREQYAAPDSESVADSLAVLGNVLLFSQANLKESGELIQRSLAIRERIDPLSVATSESLYFGGLHAAKLFDYPRAIQLHKQSLVIRERVYGVEHPASMLVQDDLATAYRRSGALDEAETIYRRVMAVRQKLHGRESEITLRSIALLASTLAAKENYREAVRLYEDGLLIAEKISGPDSLAYAVFLGNLGLYQSRLGIDGVAIERLRAALLLARKIYPENAPPRLLAERNLGAALRKANQPSAAYEQLQQALIANRKIYGKEHPEVATVLVHLSEAAVDMGRLEEARMHIDEVERMSKSATAGQAPNITQLHARVAAAEMRDDEALRLFVLAEKMVADLSRKGEFDSSIFKLPRLEFMASRSINAAERIAVATRVLEKVENVVDPSAPVLEQLRRLQRQ